MLACLLLQVNAILANKTVVSIAKLTIKFLFSKDVTSKKKDSHCNEAQSNRLVKNKMHLIKKILNLSSFIAKLLSCFNALYPIEIAIAKTKYISYFFSQVIKHL